MKLVEVDALSLITRLNGWQVDCRGVYLSLCLYILNEGKGFPDDDKIAARYCGIEIKKFREVKAWLIDVGEISAVDGHIVIQWCLRAEARYRQQRKIITKRDRAKIYSDGDGKCFYCGAEIAVNDFHIEHRIPLSRGGAHDPSNLVASCASCNVAKGRKTEDEFLRGRGK